MAAKKKPEVKEMTPEQLMSLMNKKFGAGTVKMASDPSFVIERIPCSILTIDCLLGGGFPRGRHVEVFGSSSVGKTYLAQRLVSSAQEYGGRAAWCDAEGTFEPTFAESCGVNLKELAMHEQLHGPRLVDVMETWLRSDLYDVIVLDSIASLLPLADYENEMGASSMGMEQAKLMSKALRKLTAANNKTVLFFINQVRENVGVSFGKRTLAPGGRAMSHYSGIRLEMTRIENLKRSGEVVDPKTGEIKAADVVYGHRISVRVEKDKTGSSERPLDETSFVFDYEASSHDPIEDLILLGRRYGLIHLAKPKSGKGAGRWWVDGYEDEKITGRPGFHDWLERNVAVAEELEDNIWTAWESGSTDQSALDG